MGTYSFSGTPVFTTIGATGTYDLSAYGAQGGAGHSLKSSRAGGYGAEQSASFILTQGETLKIVVGQAGTSGQISGGFAVGGGGGATLVLADVNASGTLTPGSYTPLLEAGGGGGATYVGAGASGQIASQDGSAGGGSGSGGSGTLTPRFIGSANHDGGGGAGFQSAGTSFGGVYAGAGGSEGPSYAGGAGASSAYAKYSTTGGAGGFGGGGGGGVGGYGGGGGGGGGYSGGNGGDRSAGQGGTSFVAASGTVLANSTTAGENRGNGSLSITRTTGTYGYTGAPVFVTVPTTGLYDIDAFGAQGGDDKTGNTSAQQGGNGAEAGGYIRLTAGEHLEIVVGGLGGSGTNTGAGTYEGPPGQPTAGGGGGGTFLFANIGPGGAYVPLLVAGGGGGSGDNQMGGYGTVASSGSGQGGAGDQRGYGNRTGGGGGAGVNGAGTAGAQASYGSGGGGGASLSGGFAGGSGGNASNGYFGGAGGFGGGGGGGGFYGGGGGGYSGGAGGALPGGAGGTSFDSGFAISAQTMTGVQTGNGSITISLAPADAPCYCPGTLIRTNRGEMPVEILAVGDTVVTASGEPRAIKWIGRRSYDGRFIAGNHLMLPVTIRAGALADGVPHTDLVVSPGHAMWVDGQLVPAWRLVNGVTVTQAEAVDSVAYYHVELHRHDLLLANGAPAESFLDETGFRGQFHNAAEFHRAYLDAAPLAPMQSRLEDGFALQRIQERLASRAGIRPAAEPVGALRGFVDNAGPERVCGWAQDVNSPEEPVALELLVDGAPVLTVLANGYRADLRKAKFGSGCHAFDLRLPVAGTVTVRRVVDGAVLWMTKVAGENLAA
jgi:hypothetical protein